MKDTNFSESTIETQPIAAVRPRGSGKITSHLQELQRKHTELDEKLQGLQRRPGADSLALRELKKQKLQLKDQIRRLTQQ